MYVSSWGKLSQFAVVGNLTDRVTLRHLSWGDIWDKWHPDISAKVQWDYNPKRDTELPTIRKIDRGTESDWKKMRGDLQTEPSLAVSFNYLHPLVMHNIWSKTNKLPIASLTLVSIYMHVDNDYITHTNQGHDKRVMMLKGGLFQSWHVTTQRFDSLMSGPQNNTIVL